MFRRIDLKFATCCISIFENKICNLVFWFLQIISHSFDTNIKYFDFTDALKVRIFSEIHTGTYIFLINVKLKTRIRNVILCPF